MLTDKERDYIVNLQEEKSKEMRKLEKEISKLNDRLDKLQKEFNTLEHMKTQDCYDSYQDSIKDEIYNQECIN